MCIRRCVGCVDLARYPWIDFDWASTVHAFQGRTVDNVIAAMEADHPHLTTQKSLYVEISRARARAELVTDDAVRLRERLETATGERISALEAIALAAQAGPVRSAEVVEEAPRRNALERPAAAEQQPQPDQSAPAPAGPGGDGSDSKERALAEPERRKRIEMELELEL